MLFDVRAISASHEIVHLKIHASDVSKAKAEIEAQGMSVAAINASKSPSFLGFKRTTAKAPRNALLLFSQELQALLTAGLSLIESLEALTEKNEQDAMASILSRLLLSLSEGKRFSQGLAEQADFFPSLYIGLISAAEGTGNLPSALSRYISYQERIDIVRNKLVSATIYPAILLGVGGLVTFFLVGYVVPRFAEVYQGAGRDLPWMSQLLLSWGQFSAQHSKVLLISLFCVLITGAVALHRYRKHLLSKFLELFPAIAERLRTYELARVYLTLGMLLEGGIPLTNGLAIIGDATTSTIQKQLLFARQSIESGMPCSVAFQAYSLTTPVSLRMLKVGEKTGQLGTMLTQSALFYDSEISRWIDRFARSFEPLLMAAIGLIVGTIVVLLYMPIFDLAGSLS